MRTLIKIIQNLVIHLTTVVLLFIILIGSFKPVSVSAQATGIGGFAGCDFSSIQNSPTGGAAIFEKCIQQVITFLFVIGLFLIVFRVGLSAFNTINPGASGDAIKDSVGIVRDIVIGLLLIILPSIVLSTINPATNNFNFLNLGNLQSIINARSGSGGSTTSNNSSTTNTAISSSTTSNSTTSNGGGSTTNNNNTTSATLPTTINSASDLNSALNYYKANPNSTEGRALLKTYLTKQQNCSFIFIPASSVNDCKDLNSNYSSVLSTIKDTIGDNPPLEMASSFQGQVAVTSNVQVATSVPYGSDQLVVFRYLPNTDPTGFPATKKDTTVRFSNCDLSNLSANSNVSFWSNITNSSSCSMKVVATVNAT